MLLSIGLMVKNESKFLDRCLSSLMPILEDLDAELIVADTGSTDDTVEIAKKYTERVYHHEWFNDFGGMRNVVLSYARGKWFFYLDGDEILEDASGIIRFFKSNRHKKYNSAFIEMKNLYTSGNEEQYGIFQALRFFRNDGEFHFKGIVHEQPQAKGPVARIEGTLVHYGYLSDDKELMEYKFRRNVELIKRVLEKDPDNIYHLFQLSQSYAMYGKHREALQPIEKAYHLARAAGLAKYMNVVTQQASVYFKNQMFRECETICKEGLALKDGYIDLYYFLAVSQVELGKLEEAIRAFEDYLRWVREYERGRVPIDLSVSHRSVKNTEHAYATLCAVHRKLGNYRLALRYADKATTPEVVKHVVPHIIDCCSIQRDFSEIKRFYDKWFHDENVVRVIEGAIEAKRITMGPEEKRDLAGLFAQVDSPYGLLNALRVYSDGQQTSLTADVWQRIADIDLDRTEAYYADLLLFLINHGKSIVDSLKTVRSGKVTQYFLYLFKSHEDFLDAFKSAFDDERIWRVEKDEIHVPRLKSAALYAILQQDCLSDKEYKRFFRLYLGKGLKHLEQCYSPTVLDMADASWAKTDPDGFLLVMRKARELTKPSAEYVRCLREALRQDETMKRGIEMLLQEIQEMVAQRETSELELLKKSVLTSIKKAINAGELHTAARLIREYEAVAGVDGQISAAKGVVYMIEGEWETAEKVLLEGLQIDPKSADLLYNLGYLYEVLDKPTRSMKYYDLAYEAGVTDQNLRDDVEAAISRMWQEVIPRFRRQELERRLARATVAMPQQLVEQNPVAVNDVHVVYVMTHVGVCGGVKIILEHANRLLDLGLKVTIVCHFPQPTWFPLRARYIEVPFEEGLHSGIPECDVIVATYWDHIQECIETGKAPVVYLEQGDFHLFDISKTSPEIKAFIECQYALPPFIATVSEQVSEIIDRNYGRKAVVIPNAVDRSVFNPNGARHSAGTPYILMMGSQHLVFKGVQDVIEAYRRLKARLSGSQKVDLVWITPEKPSCIPDEVAQVYVRPSQAQIAELYRGALMFVSGSYYEAFSLPVLEAMSCACPVLTTDSIGIRDYVVPGQNALVAPPGDVDALAEQMALLLGNVQLRDSLVRAGLATAGKYRWDTIISRLAQFYREVAKYAVENREQTEGGRQWQIKENPTVK